MYRLAIERMAVGGGLIVVTDRWLQFKFRGKWDEWILHFHCRANMIFAFCLESCLDTSLPLVIRQRKLSSIYKRYLLKIQNTCAYRSSNIYIYVQVKLSRNVSAWSAGNQHLLKVDFETDS